MRNAASVMKPIILPSGATYIPIQIASLRVHTITDFELHVQTVCGGSPVLYRAKCLPFDEGVRQRLMEGGTEVLYILAEDEAAYHRYMESHLGEVLADETLDTGTKSTILYASAQGLMKEIMENPQTAEATQRSKDLVQHTVKFIYTEHGAFENLLRVTSFDYYTYTHSVNVFVFSVSLAQRVGIHDLDTQTELGDGALLHDVGKSMLDPAIINCKDKLTGEQWASMKMHPVYGYDILREQGRLGERALDVVRHHHEKLGGGGYPDNITGEAITPLVRICTICDIFDALTTRRSYKSALNSFPALRLMKDEMSKDLDPVYFRAFVDMMGRQGG